MADLGSVTNLVNSAKDTVSSFTQGGPVAGLTGILDSVNGAISGITGSIGNILSGGLNFIPLAEKLPMPNPLNEFATYDYIISMGCLTPADFNFPDTSYLAGKLPPLIFKGGSASPGNRITTKAGKFDFFCSDLVITGQYGFEKSTGNTNSTNLDFTIVEPYSMGQFMIAIQQAAYQAGYRNFNEAPYLLMVEFRGQDQTGNFKAIQNTKKYIPFNFNTMSVKVTNGGSVYTCKGVPVNGQSLSDSVRNFTSDVTIKGRTVQEILQTGENSLQAALNARQTQQKKQKIVTIPDEIVIIFPTNISSSPVSGAALSTSAVQEKDTTAALNVEASINDPKVFAKLAVSRSSVNKTLVQGDGVCNAIGKAKLGYDETRPQSQAFNAYNNTVDEKGNQIRAEVNAPPTGLVDFRFSKDSDIINAINQVLLKSDVAKAALDPKQMSAEGMRPWWRIDVQTYYIATTANLTQTGTMPKLHVYRVVPYQVHASRMAPPNAAIPGIAQLKKQCAKVYDYIYTGKNTQVLKFDIDISNTFYQVFSADNYSLGEVAEASKEAGAENNSAGSDDKIALVPPTGGNPILGALPGQAKNNATGSSTQSKGGSKGEDAVTRAARLFHDAMITGMDMMNITIDIVGDPYYIANSGSGNYTADQTSAINVTKDKNINYQNGEADIIINFRTPADINQNTGFYDMKNTLLNKMFSGLYKLTTITSTFKGGKFTQTLVGNRRQGQDSDLPANPNKLVTSKAEVTELRTPAEVQASADLGDFPG